ncbi:hypothetical protein B0T25DRAFT_300518 [Lasiosphaeria hispida]|uniref:Bromodomain-containing protein n=1 Tax=Lasiosphaeria hispida TaxID=260671 RepID=A0AAJ0M947_9PEZI|nr:hypothetical protein B0T25DRAFT_300518 [Lasiosphaeria hispida]
MAVMTTPQPEGVLLDEKFLRNTSALEKDNRNGGPEVNGAASPDKNKTVVGFATEPTLKDEAKLSQNQEAFSVNQALDGEKENGQKTDLTAKASPEEAGRVSPQLESQDSALNDTLMTDAPAKSPTLPIEKETTEVQTSVANASTLPPISTTAAADSPASSAISPGTKEDVVMADTQPEQPSAPDHAESTQETAVSDVPPATPGDVIAQTAASLSIAADLSPTSPNGPATADTSVSEPSQSATKVSRERDADSEDEPVAKRAKVETPAAEQVEVKTSKAQDRMDVDRSSLYRTNGEPKMLDDNSLNNHPLTEFMAKQLRSILAGVKKTKAGMNFRLPVQSLWPGLWIDYTSKVTNPTDISTMERKLRGELPKFKALGDFKAELDLLVQNSITFNGEIHDVTASAKNTRNTVITRMGLHPAAEAAKPERKENVKQHPSRHLEHRAPTQQSPSAANPAPPRPKVTAPPPPKPPVVESPAFAIPPNNNGLPQIRRDSTKGDSRTKRPVKPAHSKDLIYDTKRKKKLAPEIRFCEEVLTEIRKQKHYDINTNFQHPVDPVALNIPSYHKVIKKPMDLSTMQSKLQAGEYQTAKEFERDFDLIVKNCRLFNGEDHIVFDQAVRLQELFRKEFRKKDEWMTKHAPAATVAAQQATTSPVPKHDSEDEDHESEGEPEVDEEQKQVQHRLVTIQKRLEEEQKKVNDMINTGNVEMADVEIAQSVVAMLQKQLMQERSKLASLQSRKPANKPKPSSKSKKPSGTSSGNSNSKKAATGGMSGGGGGGGPSRKSGGAKKATRRKIGALEKEIIAAGIAELDGHQLERAIDIIKKDTGQGENDSGELELDIEQLSDEALDRLYVLVTKAFPGLKAEKEKAFAAPPPPEPPASKSKSAASRSKKNKPMSKSEQERRIQQLNELRAQAGRQASGSQEPMESIEGNGRGSNDPAPRRDQDSEDEESSEEE